MYYIFEYENPFTFVKSQVFSDECPSFPFSHQIKDVPIRSEFQDGYTFTRPRFSKNRSTYDLIFNYLPEVYKLEIVEMEEFSASVISVKYFHSFPEYDVAQDQTVIDTFSYVPVILSEPINYELVLKTETSSYWDVSFKIEDV